MNEKDCAISVRCSTCRRSTTVPVDKLGETVECPTCLAMIEVKRDVSTAQPPPHAFSFDEKECPFCAEIIRAKAKKCKHCGEFLEEVNTVAIGDGVSAKSPSTVDGLGLPAKDPSNPATVSQGTNGLSTFQAKDAEKKPLRVARPTTETYPASNAMPQSAPAVPKHNRPESQSGLRTARTKVAGAFSKLLSGCFLLVCLILAIGIYSGFKRNKATKQEEERKAEEKARLEKFCTEENAFKEGADLCSDGITRRLEIDEVYSSGPIEAQVALGDQFSSLRYETFLSASKLQAEARNKFSLNTKQCTKAFVAGYQFHQFEHYERGFIQPKRKMFSGFHSGTLYKAWVKNGKPNFSEWVRKRRETARRKEPKQRQKLEEPFETEPKNEPEHTRKQDTSISLSKENIPYMRKANYEAMLKGRSKCKYASERAAYEEGVRQYNIQVKIARKYNNDPDKMAQHILAWMIKNKVVYRGKVDPASNVTSWRRIYSISAPDPKNPYDSLMFTFNALRNKGNANWYFVIDEL